MDEYENARQVIDSLTIGNLQWKIRQPLTDDNSQNIHDEINYLIQQLTKVRDELLPFSLNRLVSSYVDQVLVLEPDCEISKAKQCISNLLQKQFEISDEQIFNELKLLNYTS